MRTGKYVQRSKKDKNRIKLPHTNSRSKKQQKDSNLGLVERLLSKRPRRLLKFPFLPPLLPIFRKPTSTLSHGVGRFLQTTRLIRQEIGELPFNREDDQITYLLFGHGDPLLDYFRRPEKIRREKKFFKKMRFGVTANDGGSCYPPVDNNRNYFKNNEHTLGYGTHEGASVTTFERRYPSYNENGELLNFLISKFLKDIGKMNMGKNNSFPAVYGELLKVK